MRLKLAAWMSVLAAGTFSGFCRAQTAAPHHGGILRLTSAGAAGTDDPQINYTDEYQQLYAFTQDELVTYRKAEGPAGFELVPDLAETVPTPQDAGRTYVFKLRRGLKFSTGAEITVADVVASFQRIFKVLSPNSGTWYNIIVGADACLAKPAECTLAGGVIGNPADNTITIHLTHPSAEFLDQLAFPFACILPADTPPRDLGTTPPAATGPYMIASYDPTREMRLVRNPYFHQWSADAQPAGYVDEMRYRFGLTVQAETTQVENGDQDWIYDQIPPDRLAEIGARPAQAHISPMLGYFFLEMNTHLAPFDHIDARRAVSLALDRRVLVNLHGGPALGTPLCQLLPAGMRGYRPYCPFTKNPGAAWSKPDLETARALVAKSGTAGQHVTLITSDTSVQSAMGVYIQSVLNDIGYRASLRQISENIEFTYVQNTSNAVQIGMAYWFADYPQPSDFLNVLFSCGAFHPGSDASINMSGFCDPAIDARMATALATDLDDPVSGATLWAAIDHDLTDHAPLTPLFQVNLLDFVSRRYGNFRFQPLQHAMFSQAWVQ